MADENTQPSPGGLSNAVEALLAVVPSVPEEPTEPTAEAEVTKPEGAVTTEEAVVTSPQKPTVDPDDEQPQEEESDEADAEDEAPDEEAETEEADEEETDAEDSEQESEDDEPAEVDLKPTDVLFHDSDGTPVTVEEAQRGYLRQADYTKKTQEVAEHRKQLEQAYSQRQQEREVLAENLNLALSVVEPTLAELAGTDWDRLAREDAYQYAEKRALYDQAQARYNALAQQSQQVIQQAQAEQQQRRAQRMQQEAEKLKMALPEVADPKKGKALKRAIAEYAMTQGLSEEEARGIVDHRVIVMLNKARLYDDLQQSELSVARKKVSKAPKKAIKAGTPVSKSQKQERARQEKRQNLKGARRLDDPSVVDYLLS